MTTADDWQPIEIEPGVALSAPPDARRSGGVPIDSAAGVVEGDGYAITYDLGRFGEGLDALAREHGTQLRPREIGGRRGVEAAFAPDDEPFAWARIVQVDAGGGRTLTVRVSCASTARCAFADRVFDSITIA